jgi:hypothetical protein
MTKPGKAAKSAARSERLSAALRENLKRRKAQARGRKTEDLAAAEAHVGDQVEAHVEAHIEADIGEKPDFRRNPGGKLSGGAGEPGSGGGR